MPRRCRAFQSFREQLAEDTGLEPSDELATLERRIVDRDPSLDSEGRGPPSAAMSCTRRSPRAHSARSIGASSRPSAVRSPSRSSGPRWRTTLASSAVRDRGAARGRGSNTPHRSALRLLARAPGGAYLVMRYLHGGSAEERLVRHGPFTRSSPSWSSRSAPHSPSHRGRGRAPRHEAGKRHVRRGRQRVCSASSRSHVRRRDALLTMPFARPVLPCTPRQEQLDGQDASVRIQRVRVRRAPVEARRRPPTLRERHARVPPPHESCGAHPIRPRPPRRSPGHGGSS